MTDNDQAWDQFIAWIAESRRTMADRWAPVAVVYLQAETRDGATDLKPWNDAAIVWPAGFPVSERGPLLARLAKPYQDGTVLRSRRHA